MDKRIYLKSGGSIKVSNKESLLFDGMWIHIKRPLSFYGGNTTHTSIPASNIIKIEEE